MQYDYTLFDKVCVDLHYLKENRQVLSQKIGNVCKKIARNKLK